MIKRLNGEAFCKTNARNSVISLVNRCTFSDLVLQFVGVPCAAADTVTNW